MYPLMRSPSWHLGHLRRIAAMLAVAVLIALTAPAAASAQGPPEPAHTSPALLEDAADYADRFDVPLGTAVSHLRLQRVAGELAGELRTEAAPAFAGLWIERGPGLRIVVARVEGAPGGLGLQRRVAGGPLEGLTETRTFPRSLADLEERQAALRQLTRDLDLTVDLDISVHDNRVEVRAVDAEEVRSALAGAGVDLTSSAVAVVEVPALAQPATDIIGGVSLSTCTAGFTVFRSLNGDRGVSTAAHCGNSQSYSGVSLPFRSEDQFGAQDVQWHSACASFDVSNEFITGIGDRACTATRHRNNQATGAYVCKWGMTTHRSCGTIQSKYIAPSYVYSPTATFIRVDGAIVKPGDSGGPWFVEQEAWGITSGYFLEDNDGLYMAINYISSLGVSVLTYDPGPACGDGDCQSVCGENGSTCSADCYTCGNQVCESSKGETASNCSADCGAPTCGNNTCETWKSESCETTGSGYQCQQDCGCCSGWEPTCFPAGTRITLADGRQIPIEEVVAGDRVASFDPATGEVVTAEVLETLRHAAPDEPLVSIGGHLRATGNHPIFVAGGWKRADQVTSDDSLTVLLAGGSLTTTPVGAVATVDREPVVYNLDVDGSDTFFAEGVLVHNKEAYAGCEQETCDDAGEACFLDKQCTGSCINGTCSCVEL